MQAAVAKSHLRELPADVLEEMFHGSVLAAVPAGTVTHREGDQAPHVEMVVAGVIRAYVTAPDGRTMTVRYCRQGALLGAVSLFTTHFTMPGTTQALVDVRLLRMSPGVVREWARRDPRVSHAFLAELSERVVRFIEEIPGSAFTTVRQRVARHLLDLAAQREPDSGGSEIVVHVTQQELADAVGTVREVIVRVLRELRQDGVVHTGRDRIVILDPTRLF